jgi:hypothetical protein
MSSVSPRSLKFPYATSQVRLDGVPCQRSMYIMFFEGHTCKDWAHEVSLTSNREVLIDITIHIYQF